MLIKEIMPHPPQRQRGKNGGVAARDIFKFRILNQAHGCLKVNHTLCAVLVAAHMGILVGQLGQQLGRKQIVRLGGRCKCRRGACVDSIRRRKYSRSAWPL